MRTGLASRNGSERGRRSRLALAAAFATVLPLLAVSPIGPLASGVATAAPSSVTIVVKDADTGDPVPNFLWLVNVDNSHDAASLLAPASYSEVAASGEVTDGSGEVTIALDDTVAPDRGYLVSIYANDGTSDLATKYPIDYKLGGTQFSMPASGDVVVELRPLPLPLAKLRVRVFHDNQMVNTEDDIPLEGGLAGFHVALADRVGEVTTDWFGNPICTQYEDTTPPPGFGPEDVGPDGPTPIAGTGGFCATGADGYVTIPNLGPNKYEVEAIPPDGQGWIQTSTIEGTHANDAWIEEGHNGFSTEEGFTQGIVWFGFVKPCTFGSTTDDCTSATANTTGKRGRITGRVVSITLDDESGVVENGNPVAQPYVALNNLSGDDEQVYTARGNANGTFTIANVPAGLYQLVIWDGPLDHIMQFVTVRVTKDDCSTTNLGPCTVSLGDIGVPPWFGTIKGYDYLDTGIAKDGHVFTGGSGNGIRDCYADGDDFDGDGVSTDIEYRDLNSCERGIPSQDNDTRYKDGTIQYGAFADANGFYRFPEVFELEHFAIAEVGYGRMRQTGATAYETDQYGNPVNYPNGFINQDLGLASLLQAQITWGGTTNYIDFGKQPFAEDENGGIVGIAFYDSTRNELDARLEAAEDYEPGVPGTRFNLYAPVVDANGDPVYDAVTGEIQKDHLAAVYDADSWYDNLPTDCIPRGSVGRTAAQVQPPNIFSDCVELPALLPQVRPGVFDGGYAFDLDCTNPASPTGDADSDGILNRFDEDHLRSYDAGDCDSTPLSSGKWVVEVVPPDGYDVVREEDINVFSGDQFVPAVPPPPCVGQLHQVDVLGVAPDGPDATYNPDFASTPETLAPSGFGSPYEGQMKPLCNERLIDLQDGFNANSDFFLFSPVPQPGRIRGVLLDDLVLELDPTSPMYAEKRGIPNAPIGIRDYTGELITTVYSDDNGYWEVELPSTGTYNCPLPAGPCPGVYQVVGNDPGSPRNPNAGWNPNYGSLKLSFDVWPGLTTYADVAILPITGHVQTPGTQFEPPVQCDIPATTPDLQEVSRPYGVPGDTITVTGANFGTTPTATLDGVAIPTSGGGTSITATIPLSTTPGPHELLVRNGTKVSPVGITIHVFGAGYTPLVLDVGPGETFDTIQAALDAAVDGNLILVHPGVYYESLIVDEEVKLQGYGPGASVIDGRFFNFGGISADDFQTAIDGTAFDGPGSTPDTDGHKGVPMGQVITVLAEDGEFGLGTADTFNAQIDGFAIRGGNRVRGNRVLASQGGGVYAHAFARNLEVSNDLIQSNAGNFGGGVILGQAYVTNPDSGDARDNQNDGVRIHHDRILNNGGVSLAGAVALFNGAEGTSIERNVICGNYSAEYGGGISNYGMSSGGIHDNQITYNFAFDEGGGIMIAGEEPPNPVTGISAGSGDWDIARNLIQGNVSNDDGGGIRLLTPVDGVIRMVNNMIVNNLATDTGGGISLDDALDVQIVNNTVARNVSTATAEDADRTSCSPPANGTCPHGAGLVSELHSAALRAARSLPAGSFSDPVLFNNIFWRNEAYRLDGNQVVAGYTEPSAGSIDFEVLDYDGNPSNPVFTSNYNFCTAFGPNCPSATANNNKAGSPSFVLAVNLAFEVLAFGGDPSFVTVVLKTQPSDPQGNYHVSTSSPAANAATTSFGGVDAPCDDFDGDFRPRGSAFDMGADEQPLGAAPCGTPTPGGTSLYLSTAGNTAVPDVGGVYDDADIYAWDGSTFTRTFDASAVGLPSSADVDGVVVVDADTLYLSFNTDAGTSVPTLGLVQDEDVVKYDAGTWSLYFDGSDVGLADSSAEDVDAFDLLTDGNLVVSTVGNPVVTGVTSPAPRDEDLLRCAGTFGSTTTCSWTLYFDGSDVGLATTTSEDVDGVSVQAGQISLTALGAFSVTGASGDGTDVFVCSSPTTGPATACTGFTVDFDGSSTGITSNVDGIDRP